MTNKIEIQNDEDDMCKLVQLHADLPMPDRFQGHSPVCGFADSWMTNASEKPTYKAKGHMLLTRFASHLI